MYGGVHSISMAILKVIVSIITSAVMSSLSLVMWSYSTSQTPTQRHQKRLSAVSEKQNFCFTDMCLLKMVLRILLLKFTKGRNHIENILCSFFILLPPPHTYIQNMLTYMWFKKEQAEDDGIEPTEQITENNPKTNVRSVEESAEIINFNSHTQHHQISRA